MVRAEMHSYRNYGGLNPESRETGINGRSLGQWGQTAFEAWPRIEEKWQSDTKPSSGVYTTWKRLEHAIHIPLIMYLQKYFACISNIGKSE